MSHVSEISVGLAHELCITAVKAGFTAAELGNLTKNEDAMRQMRQVLLGHASISAIEHVIDLDADPYLPEAWKGIEQNQKGGHFKWDAAKVKLHLSPNQMNGKIIVGVTLRVEMSRQPSYNANLLDYLLAHLNLIPEEWKGKYVFFWGTIYRDSGGRLCVRCLNGCLSRWSWSYHLLVSDFYRDYPAVVVRKLNLELGASGLL